MTDLDHPHSPCARNVAHGRVEPRIDDDGFDATGIEVACELVRRVLVADRNGDRALHDAENRRQRFRAPAMNDREATVTTETCMLELGRDAIGQTRELAIAHVLPVPGRDRGGRGRNAAPMVDDLADRGSDGDSFRCGTECYVGHIATMTGPVLFGSACMQASRNYISLDPCVIPAGRR